MRISGIHHITAIVGHPQENVDFYASVLGLRLVKKTINFDDPDTYHLYFGDKAGNPGSIITFFPWLVKANQVDYNGKIGNGQVGVTSYAVPPGALSFWEKRLTEQNVDVRRAKRFGEDVLLFSDPHGLRLEMVEREKGPVNEWSHDEISESLAIKGFSGASLYSSNIEETASLLVDTFKYERIAREGDIIRFKSPADLGNTIDLVNAKEN